MTKLWHRLLLAVGLCSIPLWLWAQTTGGIVGRVTDESGAVLPGVTVVVESPALQGTRTTTSDLQGTYRMPLLPPGTYSVTFSLEAFQSETAAGILVGLDREATLNQVMHIAKTSETISVVADAAVISTTSTTLGSNLSENVINTLPTGRNYSSVVQVVPGTSSDANPENQGQSTITVYGSSGAENTFYIDGVNTTGVEYGFQGKDLNFEFIQEIDVKTGGYEAEYGKSTGGIINVITKSGGNEFHGDLFTYYDNDGLQASPGKIVSTGGTVEGFTKKDFGADFSGYIVKDKLWFFAAIDRVDNTATNELPAGPRAGQNVDSDSTRDLGAIKLTYNVKEGHSIIGTFFQDPRKDTGAISDADHSLNGDPATYMGRQEYGGRDVALRYEGIVGAQWLLSAQIARHGEKNSVGPESSSGDAIEYRDADNDFFQTGGFGLIQQKDFTRTFFGGSVTRYLSNHELKGGIEYEIQKADVLKRMSGGQRVDIFENAVNPDKPIYRHFYWTTPTASTENAPTSQLDATPKHKNTTFFFQDRWTISPKLTLNAGIRWDRQQIFDRNGIEVIDMKKDFAPRLGFIVDPKGDAHSRIFGSYGRYYEQVPMDLVIRSFAQERQARIYNYDPVSVTPDAQAADDFGDKSGILGGYTEPSDPNLKNQYINEFIGGYEREVRPNIAVGFKGIYRAYGRVIEDFLGDPAGGTYFIGNPGEGIMKQIYGLDFVTAYPAPKAVRKFRGFQIDVTKRFSNNWQGIASYLISKIDGNYDGEYAPFTNVGADPNISAMYDYYDFFTDGMNLSKITNTGPLSNDRRHQFKASGVYVTPYKLSIGLATYLKSGLPITRYGYSDAYGRYEFFLTKRGVEGRTPWLFDADVHIGYPLQAGDVTVNFLADIFNIFDTRRPIMLDQRWGFQEADNAMPAPSNPNYKQPVLRTPPTSLRVGLRVSF